MAALACQEILWLSVGNNHEDAIFIILLIILHVS